MRNASGVIQCTARNASGIKKGSIKSIDMIQAKHYLGSVATSAYFERQATTKKYKTVDRELCLNCKKTCKGDCEEARKIRGIRNEKRK